MMNQSKSPAYSVGRYLRMLPLILLFLSAVSLYASQRESAEVDLTPASALIPATPLQEQRYSLQQPPPEKQRVETFTVVEVMPEFPGGNRALVKFLSGNIQYPAIAKENEIQGRVICSFIVMDDGSIRDLYVERGVDPSLDAEAMRVLRLMPDWKPGRQKGVPVNIHFSLPIEFRLPVEKERIPAADTIETEKIFIDVEVQPEFPGGVPAMMRFLSENIRYPVVAITNKIEGRVICQFMVKKDGTISDVAVVRGVDPQLDAEAKRVLELMPLWEPGIQQGEAVNVRYTVPVVFRLRGNDSNVITDGLLTNSGAHSRQITEPQKEKLAETEEILTNVEVQPEFPGGMKEMVKFLSENLTYPEPPGCQDIQGRVICSFVVMKDGTISDVKVVRGLHPHLDAEAIRVLQSMPKWKPGTHRGQAVDVLFSTAVVYRLQH